MKFCSTNNREAVVGLKEAVLKGLADDNGLYMPVNMPKLPDNVIENISEFSFQEIAFEMAKPFMGEDIPESKLSQIVTEAFNFDVPLVKVQDNISALELFHGPTLAFKDFGARFMARLLGYFTKDLNKEIHVLVATSGDTGSAVANGFLGVPGIKVHVLFPSGLVTKIQEKQFTTLGQNITALEIDGTFDDCQHLVKQAFLDPELKETLILTSANSINLGRLIPQSFYYAYAFAQASKSNPDDVVFSVPSGNFGNLTAGLFAKAMGIPVKHFIAATNMNDIFPKYLETSVFEPKSSVATIANAMDVGNPSNFARILHLYNHSHKAISNDISGFRYQDNEVKKVLKETYETTGYMLDPHGAIGFIALKNYLASHGGNGIFLETAHPAKFMETVEPVIGTKIEIPAKLQKFIEGESKTSCLSKEFGHFKSYLKTLN